MKAQGNMYPDVETWNPLSGVCPHGCTYCSSHSYMRYPAFAKKYSGELRLDENAMKVNLGRGKKWFVCAQNDLFAWKTPGSTILAILEKCRSFNHNIYFFQTKNPQRVLDFLGFIPERSIICTTLETNRWMPEIMKNSPHPELRCGAMDIISGYFTINLTLEPLMKFDLVPFVDMIRMCGASKVNIGMDSKHNHLPEPTKEEILTLIDELKKFTSIDQKRNLQRLIR